MNPAAVLSVLVNVQGLAAANSQLNAFDKSAERTAKSSSAAGRAMGLAFKGTAVAAVGAGAGLYGAVKASATFEKQMSSLKAVTDANAKTMAEFKKQAIDAGIKTSFSAKQAAEAQTELAKGGLSVKNIMGGGLRSALALAAAGNMDLADAASTTANAMNLFGLRGAKSKMVADQLAMAANATTADVKDFAEALKQGGSVAKSAGLSFTETNVALEALAAAGIKGSDAGTSLKTALLQMIAPSSTKAAAAMEEFGLKFTDANGEMKSMSSISAMLRDKLGDMTAAQRTSTLATIVGTDGVRTLTSLYDAGPRKLDSFRKGLEKQGTAARVAATMQDNLSGKLEQFKGTLETIAIVVGDKVRPTVQRAVEALTDFANGLLTGQGAGGRFRDAMVNAFNTVKTVVLDVVTRVREFSRAFQDGEGKAVALGAALAGLAAGAVAIQVVVGATRAWAAAQAAVNIVMSANPFVIAAAALVALGAAFFVAYQKSETFRKAVDAVFAAIKGALTAAITWISGAVQTVIDEVSEWKLLFAVVAAAWKVYFAILSAQVRGLVTTVVAVFKVGMAVIGPIAAGAWEGIKQIFTGAVRVITGIVKVFGGVLKGDWGQIWDGVKQIFSGAWEILKGIVRTALGAIVGYLRAVPARVLTAAAAMGTAIADGILSGMGQLGHLILDKVSDALDFVGDNLPGPLGAAAKIGTSIAGKIGDGAGKAAKVALPSGAGLAGGSLMGASSIMSPFVSMAGRFGLRTSSGLRPGAITSSGRPSYHASGNAVDEAGSPAGMLGYFKYLRANFGSRLRELIYTPGGVGIKDGKPFRYTGKVAEDHFDHVHVAFTGGAGDGLGRAPRKGDGIGEIKSLWTRAGGSSAAQNLAAAVAMAESGGRADASNRNSDGSIDRGLWQINSIHGGLSTFNRLGNAKAAVKISSNGRNWNPWVAFKNGAYKRFLSAASKAPKGKTKTVSSPASSGSEYTSSAVNAPDSPTYAGQGATDPLGNSNTINLGRIKDATRPLKGGGPSKGITPGFIPLGSMDPRSDPRNAWLQGEFKKANAAAALATLTADTGDDLAAAQRIQQIRSSELDLAKASGDSDWIAEAATNLKSATDAIDALTQATQEQTALMQQQLDLVKQDRDEYKRSFAVSQSQYGTLAQAIADVANGQIGQRLGLGLSGLRAAPGSVARI